MCFVNKKSGPLDNSKKEIKNYKPLGRKGDLYSFFITYTDGTSERVDITLESRTYEKIYLFHLAHEKPRWGITADNIEIYETIEDD